MGLGDRPYIGTWRLNGQELIQHTPDALVYINGDMSIPGCPKCNGRIDLQQFLTEVSVDAGTDPGSASSSFTLAIPLHHTDSFARDANFILHPGLEVHVYMRGFFPVKGLYKHLAEPKTLDKVVGGDIAPEPGKNLLATVSDSGEKVTLDGFLHRKRQGKPTRIIIHESGMNGRKSTEHTLQNNGTGVHYIVGGDGVWKYYDEDQVVNHTGGDNNPASIGIEFNHAYHGKGEVVDAPWFDGGKYTLPSQGKLESLWGLTSNLAKEQGIPVTIGSVHGDQFSFGAKSGTVSSGISSHKAQAGGHSDGVFPTLYMALRSRGYSPTDAYQRSVAYVKAGVSASGSVTLPPVIGSGATGKPKINKADTPHGEYLVSKLGKIQRKHMGLDTGEVTDEDFEDDHDHEEGATTPEAVPQIAHAETTHVGPSLLEELGLAGQGIEDVMAYPYYHVFHGVVTEVGHSYSGGVNTITVNCSSMLHFWQYQNMSTNASVFGARALNSGNKMSMVGHNFTGMHPYQIIYTLHHDMVGAAGGVGWALGSKTNQTAKSEVAGESLFSLNVRYWEKRFAGRMAKLRLHGATGELFTTMQAAWLGRTSSANLMGFFRRRFNTAKSETSPGSLYNQAVSVGLFNRRRLRSILRQKGKDPDNHGASAESTLVAYRNQETKGNEPVHEINIVEMQAFVTNIGNWGQVNLFESSYESKLDIANKVCEVTGFEFFQDVDGDFVFKPPMWNLDTSASRVYRIEDIDIINIAFSEKEPQVTYMTVKGSSVVMQNADGLGTENEWGLRGQYIDFRLVAQFGWRPGSYETAYFTDQRAMFFAAVNRMDIMNAGTNSATVTIPLRPELRPGYPVYIPYVDAFYYCNSFSHSYSVGGQCTTTLQLIAKRAKFFAPGNPAESGIGAIDLGKTSMPQRPLEVIEQDGKPRLSGFPNVVMAIDPEEVNPLFFVVGADIERLDDPRVLKWLLEMGASANFRVLTKEELGGGDAHYLMDVPVGANGVKKVAFFFQDGAADPAKAVPAAPDGRTVVNTLAEGKAYQEKLKARSKEVAGKDTAEVAALQAKIEVEQGKLNAARAEMNAATDDKKPKYDKQIAAANAEIVKLEARKEKLTEAKANAGKALEAQWKDPTGKHQGIAFLLSMVEQIGEKFRMLSGNERFGNLNSTINLLDMLSDKKATFTNGTIPGVYRYYSASHPDPVHQAPKVLNYSSEDRLLTVGPLAIEVDDGETISPVKTYTKQPKAAFEGGRIPEAGFEDKPPVVGIRVLNSNPKFKKGQVIPTSDIMEMMFSPAAIRAAVQKTSTKKSKVVAPFGLERAKSIGTTLFTTEALGGPPTPDTVMSAYYKPSIDKVNDLIEDAIYASYDTWPANIVPDVHFQRFSIEGLTAKVGPYSFSWDDKFGSFRYSGSSGTKSLGPTVGKFSLTDLANKFGEGLAIDIVSVININYALLYDFLIKKGVAHDEALRLISVFVQVISGVTPAAPAASSPDRVQGVVLGNFTTEAHSPVFPVSDANGYTVIGSYRYGRGVNIDPQGVFNQLHNVDVFALLDKTTVEKVLRFFVQRKPEVKLPLKKEIGLDGKVKWSPTKDGEETTFTGADAASALNTEVIRQLKMANLTDKQILDYGIAVQSATDPSQLDFQLANWFADQSKEGIGKLPIINAAFSLADLTVRTGGSHICECKAAEAHVLIEAFGRSDFMSFGEAGAPQQASVFDEPADAGTQWVAEMALRASAAWKVNQDALRGQVLDKGRSRLVEGIKSLDDQWDAAKEQTEQQIDGLKAAVKAAKEQAKRIGEDK